jgi:flagellar protein FlgJ
MDTSNNLYHDLNSLNQLRLQSKTSQRETLRAAVKEFEAYFLNLMLKNMRQTNKLFSEDNPLSSDDVEFYNDMHDQQLALELSRSSKFGIGDLLFRQLSKHLPKDGGEKETPLIRPNESSSKLNFSGSPDLTSNSTYRTNSIDSQSSNEVGKSEERNPERAAVSLNKEQSFKSELSQLINTLTSQRQSNAEVFNNADKNLLGSPSLTNIQTDKSTELSKVSVIESEFSFNSKGDFIKALKPYAIKASQLLGVNPGLLIAQAALETGWGKHLPKNDEGKPSLNLFGIKADSRWSGETVRTTTLEFIEGIPEKLTQAFRAYPSIQDSFEDYVNFIRSNPRYQPALEKASEPKAYLEEIQKSGYATDPNYAEKIHTIFIREQLFRIDE